MDARELRLGNWIQFGSKNLDVDAFEQVCNIVENGINASVTRKRLEPYLTFEDIKPISLTAEWLERAGFKHLDMADLGHIWFFDIESRLMSINWTNGSIWIGQYDTKIKYVHQLQNLYFALTGTELEFKNTTNGTTETHAAHR